MVSLKDITPIQIDKILEKEPKNRVVLVGVELEGGWDALPKGTQVIRDGSVTFHHPINIIGELPSPPLQLGETFRKWMKLYYPPHINATCGMHVHMSFKHALTYQATMRPEYPATIIAYVAKWAADKANLPLDHPIWPRLKGQSKYCQHIFQANEQALSNAKDFNQERQGHRYTIINYPWAQHTTVECRLLPMMATVTQGIEAIEEVVKITNAFLLATAAKEPKLKIGIDEPGGNESDHIESVIPRSEPERRRARNIILR